MSSLQTSYRHPAGAAPAGRDANRAAAAILLKHNVNFLRCGDSPVRHSPARNGSHIYINESINTTANERNKKWICEGLAEVPLPG